MKVLVVGSGAREHALCWRLNRSVGVSRVYAAPGNPGIAALTTCVPIAVHDVQGLLAYATQEQIDLTVVGPEAALAAGVVDAFEAEGRPIVGPTRAAAMLESSKSFAKEIMEAAGVPTARYEVCTSRSSLSEYCMQKGAPLVLKADGLASGKGVFVIERTSDFPAAIEQLFGELRAEKVVVEEFLRGVEVSCIFAANGKEVVALAPAHDYKRLRDNDKGPNTGGMGSVCPTPRVNEDDVGWIERHCAQPVIDIMAARGVPFRGFLYAGLMIDPSLPRDRGVRVLEYNTRLGDPECQSIMARVDSGLSDLLLWMCGQRVEKPLLTWSQQYAVCVVVASDGYPEKPVEGDVLSGLELTAMVPDTIVFHASTKRSATGELVSSGGRTMSVVGLGDTPAQARGAAYKVVDMIQLRGRRVRRDVGV